MTGERVWHGVRVTYRLQNQNPFSAWLRAVELVGFDERAAGMLRSPEAEWYLVSIGPVGVGATAERQWWDVTMEVR